jgi:laminin, gamma 1
MNTIQIIITLLITFNSIVNGAKDTCYDNEGRPKYCTPQFINAAFNRPVIATNTCGSNETYFCQQSAMQSFSYDYYDNKFDKCDICDNKRIDKSHPAEYLTDFDKHTERTWWQSDTMENDIQYPTTVNLTLNLGKSFIITYVQIKFQSPRPESFAIYKRQNESADWEPYQYYSSDCKTMYNTPPDILVSKDNEAIALCTDEFSDIVPLSGGSVAFSTLEHRPSGYLLEDTPALKEFVTATDIRISLNRLNTYRDEIFRDPYVLRSYYYAISDIAVGGTCNCNGHAADCIQSQNENFEDQYKCVCEHNTDGIDCNKCLPFFNDQPWAPTTIYKSSECKPCNCNGLSRECYFDETLYTETGHGGHCINCIRNTDGPHCENCKLGFYRQPNSNECVDCECNKIGSKHSQCDPFGTCSCKPGVTGPKCDRCEANYYGLNSDGCQMCSCDQRGSFDSPATCDERTGQCRCKLNVEGKNCDQ